MKSLIFLVLIQVPFYGCENSEIAKDTPECLKRAIKDFAKASPSCSNATVEEYTFQGATVYVFQPGTCGADLSADVLDSECNNLGFLGGFIGNTKINGEEFSKAIFKKTVWRK